MHKRLLIVCDSFPPNFAPRVGNLCKFLSDEYDISIITEESNRKSWPIEINRENLHLHSIKLSSNNKYVDALYKVGDYLFSLNDIRLFRKSVNLLKGNSYDLVFCASYYIFPLLCGKKLAKRLNIPLHIDLRDIMEQNAKAKGITNNIKQFFKLRWLNQWRRNRILKQASTVTTVSPWHVNTLKRYNDNVHLIYNGYDSDKFFFEKIETEKFIISYTGRLLDITLRDPSLFFEAIRELVTDSEFAQDLEIQWYVDNSSKKEVETMTKEYGIYKYNNIHETISSDKMPNILNKSSIALVLSNIATEDGPHGIMTTKFYEALGCERPVLCVRSDEDCLANTIQLTNAGVAASNLEGTKKFILEKYQEWKENHFTHQIVNQEEKAKFTRQIQAQQFEALFNKKC